MEKEHQGQPDQSTSELAADRRTSNREGEHQRWLRLTGGALRSQRDRRRNGRGRPVAAARLADELSDAIRVTDDAVVSAREIERRATGHRS